MANFMEHLGLDFLVETEDQVRGLWGYIAQEGKAITGYYGYPYLNQHFGDAQLILRTIRNDEEKRICYVAATRAKETLIWMTARPKGRRKQNYGDFLSFKEF